MTGPCKTIRPLYCAVTNYFQETLLFKGSLIHLQSQMSLEGNLGHFQQIMIITDMLRLVLLQNTYSARYSFLCTGLRKTAFISSADQFETYF